MEVSMGYITMDITWDICWKLKNTQKKVSFPILSRFPKFFLEKLHCAANVFSLYFIWCSVYFNCSVLCCWFACFFSAFLFFPKTNQKYNFRLNRRLNSGLKSENFLHFLRFSNVQQMSQVFSWKIRILQPNCYLFHDGLTFFVFSDLLLILVVFGFVCSFVRASTLTRSMLTTPGSKKQQTIWKHRKTY